MFSVPVVSVITPVVAPGVVSPPTPVLSVAAGTEVAPVLGTFVPEFPLQLASVRVSPSASVAIQCRRCRAVSLDSPLVIDSVGYKATSSLGQLRYGCLAQETR